MYDLKGSVKGREAFLNNELDCRFITQKDLNFINSKEQISLSYKENKIFNELIKNDAMFLNSLEIMDYSLFLVKVSLSETQVRLN